MNNTIINDLKKDKYRILIIVLLLVFIIRMLIDLFDDVFVEGPVFVVLSNLISCVLFIIYVSFLQTKQKGTVIMPVILGMIAISQLFISNIIGALFCVLSICVLSMRSVVRWLSSKNFIIIAMALCLGYNYAIGLPINGLYIALILFVLKYEIPTVLSKVPEKMTPEQELYMLKVKLDLNSISEEEYQEQRAKIINNL